MGSEQPIGQQKWAQWKLREGHLRIVVRPPPTPQEVGELTAQINKKIR